MKLGELKEVENKLDEAFFYYNLAYTKNINNSIFILKLAKLQKKSGQINHAINLLETALVKIPNVSAIYIELANLFKDINQLDKAYDILKSFPHKNEEINKAIIKLELMQNYQYGKELYINEIRKELKNYQLLEVLASFVKDITCAIGYEQLCYWILLHWHEVFGIELEDRIQKELMEHD